MVKIKVISKSELYDGMSVIFQAPCDSTTADGLNVYYHEYSQSFSFRDAHKNDLAGQGDLFVEGAYIKAILDTRNGYAYVQNTDSNAYLKNNVVYVPSYLALISKQSDDSVAAALGKNNPDIIWSGMALAKYETYNDPTNSALSSLSRIETIDDLFNSPEALADLGIAPYAKALLEENSFTADRFSNIPEDVFCSSCARMAGDPGYQNVRTVTDLVSSMTVYSSAYTTPFYQYSASLELYKEQIKEGFFASVSASQIFEDQGYVDLCLDNDFLNEYMDDNPDTFLAAANSSSLLQTNTVYGSASGSANYTGTKYVCEKRCFVVSASLTAGRCYNQSSLKIGTGLYRGTLASVSGTNNSVSWSGFAVCRTLDGYANLIAGTATTSGSFISHS